MYIKNISLKNYRNLEQININLNKGISILYGDNGQGKTNFLESLYFCAMGRSHRTHNDRELINFNADEAFIKTSFDDDGIVDKISIHIKKFSKKGIAVNNIPIRRLGDLFGKLNIVIFSPQDLQLVKNGPSERRKFMDMEICQISNIYYHELSSYHRVLRQRNNLLKLINKNRESKNTLSVWDEQLVKHGEKIYKLRNEFISELSLISSEIYAAIANKKEKFDMKYKPNVPINNFYDKLVKNRERDIYLGTTNVGLHKDDINIFIDDYDVRIYGSQGQQRTASLSIKLAEIELINLLKNSMPVLLLDDVLSELDQTRQIFLLGHINKAQTIITCTGVEDIVKRISSDSSTNIFCVDNGCIKPL